MDRPVPLWRVIADLFPRVERLRLFGVFALSIVAALFEVLGVASILPFMALVVDPSAIDRHASLRTFAEMAGVTTTRGTLLLIGGLTAAIIAVGNATAALNVRAQQKFGARTITRISSSIFAGYLRQPYAFHMRRDVPSLIKVVLTDSYNVVTGVVLPAILGFSRATMVSGILALLFIQNPRVAIMVALVLGGAYVVIFRLIRGRQRWLGEEANRRSYQRHHVSHEAFGGIKELRVLGREEYVAEQFKNAMYATASAQAGYAMVSPLPRYVLEPLAFGGIILATLALIAGGDSSAQTVVPTLALYAFAGYRLLPALQQMFEAAMTVRFNLPPLRALHTDFKEVSRERPFEDTQGRSEITFTKEIRLTNVTFHYAGARVPAIRDATLAIRRNESIGLVGRSGSGKTTLADLILGLHEPTEGRITVDGVQITPATARAWRQRIGYVAQHVFLANASVAENIAFGLPPHKIDHEAIRKAARLAQAETFITALPNGFDTDVGERGIRLSGGQRQRIGIARALYDNPDVLVFDEATSALDGLTEDDLMSAIRSLSGERTIILIAHRLRTLDACDRIVVLEQGRILGADSYDRLLDSSEQFRLLAGQMSGVTAAAGEDLQSKEHEF